MYAPRVVYSVIFFVLVMTLLVVSKPSALFDPRSEGRPRPFGTGPGHTMFTLGVVTVLLAVLSLYMFTLIDMVFR